MKKRRELKDKPTFLIDTQFSVKKRTGSKKLPSIKPATLITSYGFTMS